MPPTLEFFFLNLFPIFFTLFGHIWQFWTILDHFGDPEKNRSKVTSKNSGTLTGRTNDSHLRQKNDPQNFEKKLKKVTFGKPVFGNPFLENRFSDARVWKTRFFKKVEKSHF